mmetsp:Transcript_4622/g.10095  ORF Transcript_4622/g.10095 Transcript_4622/m.10095 type:complete len:209 (+) Transcript_4622:2309-2935(+)
MLLILLLLLLLLCVVALFRSSCSSSSSSGSSTGATSRIRGTSASRIFLLVVYIVVYSVVYSVVCVLFAMVIIIVVVVGILAIVRDSRLLLCMCFYCRCSCIVLATATATATATTATATTATATTNVDGFVQQALRQRPDHVVPPGRHHRFPVELVPHVAQRVQGPGGVHGRLLGVPERPRSRILQEHFPGQPGDVPERAIGIIGIGIR